MDILSKNVDITHLSNYQTPAKAQWYFELSWEDDIDKLSEIVSWSKEENIPILWVSWGTNMLFAFDVYEWIVVKNSLVWWTYDENSKILESYWSEGIWSIAESLEEDYWQDLWHRFIGLPGSIAGAIYGNAGCFGLETENNFVSCRVLGLESWQESIIQKKDMDFSYRSSVLKETKKHFIISAIFDLSEKIEKYHSDVDNIDFRENKQPKWNSCGSFFKNPSREQSAWFLIEQVWLKGKEIWWAMFSDIHANFLMNTWDASHQDMLHLIEMAKKRVKEEFNIDLINEVQIITNTKND